MDEFKSGLDEVKQLLEKGQNPAKIMEELHGEFDAFKQKLQASLEDPSSLVPAGGLVACGSMYEGQVSAQLNALHEEADEMLVKIREALADVTTPMQELGKTLASALAELDGSVTRLRTLPGEIHDISETVKSHADAAKIDVDPLRRRLDCSAVHQHLDSLVNLKAPLQKAIASAKTGIEDLVEYLQAVPGKVQSAFVAPPPFCFVQGMFGGQLPEAMKELLSMVQGMMKMDMELAQEVLGKVGNAIIDLDPRTVSEPIGKFAGSAKEHVDALDELVVKAKRTSSPSSGSKLMGPMRSLKKMF